MRVFIFMFFALIGPYVSYSQNIIQGRIVNQETKEGVPGAHVFIDNSTLSTSSDASGSFVLNKRKFLNFNLVFSAMGYETKIVPIKPNSFNEDSLLVKLTSKPIEIAQVEVLAPMKDGWKVWGKKFIEYFIGTTSFAKQTRISNPQVIQFKYNEEDRILTAMANEPIQIVNKALGYKLYYDLEDFTLDIQQNHVFYEGNLWFVELNPLTDKMITNRETAYQVSLMRFLRSTFHQSWQEDGYSVRKLIKKENHVRRAADSTLNVIADKIKQEYGNSPERYWHRKGSKALAQRARLLELLSQPEELVTLKDEIVEEDFISSRNRQDKTIIVSYPTPLYLENKEIKPETAYIRTTQKNTSDSPLVFEPESVQIVINEFGGYSPIRALSLGGYLGWFNKMSTMLPLDYAIH